AAGFDDCEHFSLVFVPALGCPAPLLVQSLYVNGFSHLSSRNAKRAGPAQGRSRTLERLWPRQANLSRKPSQIRGLPASRGRETIPASPALLRRTGGQLWPTPLPQR